jgi:hypothetical protein
MSETGGNGHKMENRFSVVFDPGVRARLQSCADRLYQGNMSMLVKNAVDQFLQEHDC